MTTYLTPYLYSLDIHDQQIAGTIPDPMPGPLPTDEIKRIRANYNHRYRINQFDRALLHSKDSLELEFKQVKNSYPQIDEMKWRMYSITVFQEFCIKVLPTAFKKELISGSPFVDKEFLLYIELSKVQIALELILTLIRSNSSAVFRHFIKLHKAFDPIHGSFLLHTACDFLRVDIVRLLIEVGADVNQHRNFIGLYGDFSQIPPLFSVLSAARRMKIFYPSERIDPAIKIVKLLLERGADPDARIYLSEEDEPPNLDGPEFEQRKIPLREYLTLVQRDDPNLYHRELVDLIIRAPERVLESKENSGPTARARR